MKLRQKLFLILLFMALLPTVCLTAVSYLRYQSTTQQQMKEYSSNLFSKAVQQANTSLKELEKISSMFSSYSSGNYSLIQNLKPYADEAAKLDELSIYTSRQNLKYLCQNFFNTYDFIYGIYIFTPSGINFTFEDTQNHRLQYNYTPYAEDWYMDISAQRGSLYISSIGIHSSIFRGAEESFFIARNLYDVYSSSNLGTLMIQCSPSVLDLSALNTLPDVTSILLADPNRSRVIYSTGMTSHTIASVTEMEKQAAYSTELAVSGLMLYAFVDFSRLYHEFSTTGFILLLIALFCLIIGILLALYFSRTVAQPIVHLSRKMARQSSENLKPSSLYQNRTDEIGILYNEYNSMIEELDTAIRTNYQNKLISLDAQMKSLEACINSHFLFNTLEAVNSIASIEGSQRIQTIAMSLGNMFRYAIKTQSELVTLQDEINHVNDYVSIQSIRFSGRFLFQMRIPKCMHHLKVLKLILQPIVENSFSHGLMNCQMGRKIYIWGFLHDSSFELYIADDGKGMTAEQLSTLTQSLTEEPAFTELGHRTSQSIGLKNINTRIELYYGKGYGLSVLSRPQRGTLIAIKLPYLEREETNHVPLYYRR